MDILTAIMAIFAMIGAIDLIFNNRFGIGAEFKRGLFMLGELALSMVGMIILSPLIAYLLTTPLQFVYNTIHIDPSSFIGCILANDMGGATLAQTLAIDGTVGRFNGLITASMMGATFSFTLPFVMGAVEKKQRDLVFLGLICGICTIPIGCFVSGLLCRLSVITLLLNILPLLVLSLVCSIGLLKFRKVSIKIFNVIGVIIRTVVIAGLAVGITEFLLKKDIVPYTASLEEGISVVLGIAAVMCGAFPLVYLLTKLLSKPLKVMSKRTGLNEQSLVGFLSTLATSVTTFGKMKDMDDRGVVLNSAFAVSAAFTFADHMAFTMAFDGSYLWQMILGKLLSGVAALVLAVLITRKKRAE